MNDIIIRDCRASDGPALFKLFGNWDPGHEFDLSLFTASLEDILAGSGGDTRIFVADSGSSLVGYAQLGKLRRLGFIPDWEIMQLLVLPELRSSGIGAALLARIEELARNEGCSALILSSQSHRQRAHAFYERNGFRQFKESRFYEKNLEECKL